MQVGGLANAKLPLGVNGVAYNFQILQGEISRLAPSVTGIISRTIATLTRRTQLMSDWRFIIHSSSVNILSWLELETILETLDTKQENSPQMSPQSTTGLKSLCTL